MTTTAILPDPTLIRHVRHRANRQRSLRCYGRIQWAWWIPADRRVRALGYARLKHRNARLLESRCFVARAWSWYYAGGDCVHSGEASWVDPNAPYWGGLQADLSFQRTYGYMHGSPGEFLRRWGTADHWPIWAQVVMGYRGWLARGWYPWPTTARRCGLI